MRLLLTWLLGVPLMVCGMVLARAALLPQRPAVEARPPVAVVQVRRSCPGQDEQHGVRLTIPQQRHIVPCDSLAIED